MGRERVAELARAIIGFPPIEVVDRPLLLRAVEVYERWQLAFVDAYLVACAETSGVGAVSSFDRGLERIGTVRRVVP